CTVGTSDDAPDPLIALARDAERDAAEATRLASGTTDDAPSLHVIADERRAHAEALRTEIDRVAADTTDPESAQTPTGVPSEASAPAAPTVDELRGALATSQRAAADTARGLTGYRAGLAGSISAACAAEQKVLLP